MNTENGARRYMRLWVAATARTTNGARLCDQRKAEKTPTTSSFQFAAARWKKDKSTSASRVFVLGVVSG